MSGWCDIITNCRQHKDIKVIGGLGMLGFGLRKSAAQGRVHHPGSFLIIAND